MTQTTNRIHSVTLPILFDNLAIGQLPTDTQSLIWQIDALLPQTQCGLCGHQDGCLPYAHAIATQGESYHLCVPGGDDTAHALAKLLNKPALPAMPSKWAIDPTTNRPQEMLAIIDESACIGCTKCIPACPVDAIIGTAKHMHSIIADACTGCELCLAPCPVDCIDIVPASKTNAHKTTAPNPNAPSANERLARQDDLRQRYHQHLNRLTVMLKANTTAPVVSHTQSKLASQLQASQTATPDSQTAQTTIAIAKLRSQIKKLQKQLAVRPDPQKAGELDRLSHDLSLLEQPSP